MLCPKNIFNYSPFYATRDISHVLGYLKHGNYNHVLSQLFFRQKNHTEDSPGSTETLISTNKMARPCIIKQRKNTKQPCLPCYWITKKHAQWSFSLHRPTTVANGADIWIPISKTLFHPWLHYLCSPLRGQRGTKKQGQCKALRVRGFLTGIGNANYVHHSPPLRNSSAQRSLVVF